jgi:hypothetical protein
VLELDGRLRQHHPGQIRQAIEAVTVRCRAYPLAATAPGAGKPDRGEALALDARVSHGSNINALCESCGKPKAAAFAQIFVAATAGFFAAKK